MLRNPCPLSAGIGVRFQQELLSVFSKNCCPFSARICNGKQVIITKLPVKHEGKDEITLGEKGEGDVNIDSPIVQQRKLIQSIEQSKDLPLTVPDRLSSRPDKLIRSTLDYYDAVKRYYKSHCRLPQSRSD